MAEPVARRAQRQWNYMTWGRRCAENTTNRRLTQNAVARITHSGAPDAIRGMAASWALPANTSSVMATASKVLMPDLHHGHAGHQSPEHRCRWPRWPSRTALPVVGVAVQTGFEEHGFSVTQHGACAQGATAQKSPAAGALAACTLQMRQHQHAIARLNAVPCMYSMIQLGSIMFLWCAGRYRLYFRLWCHHVQQRLFTPSGFRR